MKSFAFALTLGVVSAIH
jgi:cathepsin L